MIQTLADQQCLVHWQGWFTYTSDALSEFYRHGLDALGVRFRAAA